MSTSRTSVILDDWRVIADAVVMPGTAPRPSRRSFVEVGVLASLVAVVVLVAVSIEPTNHAGTPPGLTASPHIGSTSSGVPALPDVPIDSKLTAVSRSNPEPDAKLALALSARQDVDAVAGMARIAAKDVHKYTLTNGGEPELQDDALVWAVQLEGAIVYRSGTLYNPLCVVRDGYPTIYAPYGSAGWKDWSPPPDFVGPELALPPLVP